jgi:mono/diheme cytochrome c family protein
MTLKSPVGDGLETVPPAFGTPIKGVPYRNTLMKNASMRALILGLAVVLSTAAAMAGQAEPPPGKVPYDRVCRVCHGEDARGDAGPRLVPLDMEYEEVIAKVREGGSEMPPISTTTVSDDEVKQIFAYLKSLSPAADHAASHVISRLVTTAYPAKQGEATKARNHKKRSQANCLS